MLAGGQWLVPLLSMRLAAPAMLVDINALPDLDHVPCTDDGVRVGALARHADVLADRRRRAGAAAGRAGARARRARDDPQPGHDRGLARARGRRRGDAGGADAARWLGRRWPRSGGRRTIAADDLFVGPLESTLAADEIARRGVLPGAAAGAGVAFEEVARRHGDYALCRGRRAGPGRRRRAWSRPGWVPVGVRRADGRRRQRRAAERALGEPRSSSSNPPTTSTPPPTTAPSWCGC